MHRRGCFRRASLGRIGRADARRSVQRNGGERNGLPARVDDGFLPSPAGVVLGSDLPVQDAGLAADMANIGESDLAPCLGGPDQQVGDPLWGATARKRNSMSSAMRLPRLASENTRALASRAGKGNIPIAPTAPAPGSTFRRSPIADRNRRATRKGSTRYGSHRTVAYMEPLHQTVGAFRSATLRRLIHRPDFTLKGVRSRSLAGDLD